MAQEYSRPRSSSARPRRHCARSPSATIVTVGFGPEPAGAQPARGCGCRTRPRDLPAEEAAQLRGAADSMALRLRYHDDAVHSRRAPGGPLARAVFEAVEQARVEALGARRMAGVAANLAAMLDEQYRRQGFERITERTDSTMAEAVRLLTREALTRERAAALGAARRRSLAALARRQDRQGFRRARPRHPRSGRLCAGDPPAAPGSRSSISARSTRIRRTAKSSRAARRPRARTRARARAPPPAREASPDGSPADGAADDAQDAAEAERRRDDAGRQRR